MNLYNASLQFLLELSKSSKQTGVRLFLRGRFAIVAISKNKEMYCECQFHARTSNDAGTLKNL